MGAMAAAKSARRPAPRTGRKSLRFRAKLEPRGPRGAWCHVFFPPEASALLGRRGAAPIVLSVAGRVWRVTALPDGRGGHVFQFNGALRAEAGVAIGDTLEFELALDREPRTLELAADLAAALDASPAARAAFDAMPPSHRRAYVEWVDEVKSPSKRVERIEKSVRRMIEWGRERAAKRRGVRR